MKIFIALVFVSLVGLTRNYKLRDTVEDGTKNVTTLDLKGTLKRSFAGEAMALKEHGNVVCSPLSALLPLGKLILGTDAGASRDELLKAIGAKKTEIKNKFRDMFQKLKYLPGVNLTVASRLYLDQSVKVLQQYERDTKFVFYSSVYKLDFTEPEEATTTINSWVNSQTNGKINDLVSPSDIGKDTKMLLVNAVYFAGRWTDPFNKLFVGEFHTPSKTRKIPMMSQKNQFNFYRSEILDAKIVEILYEGNKASFVLVLPNKQNGLPMLLSELKLAPEVLNKEMMKMEPTDIVLTMPKFKIETELDLKTLYEKIGVRSVFTIESGLTRISKEPLVLSKAIQKAYIEVTEKGTEAAAASDVIGVFLSANFYPRVTADHPFLFFVVAGKEQLFVGIFNE